LTRLHIEDAAAAPDAAAAWLAARLDLTPAPALFRGADAAILNRWVTKASPADRARLDARLGGWAAHFGYDPARIGWRPCSGLPGIELVSATLPDTTAPLERPESTPPPRPA
jgi:hypothetical protein